MIQFTFEGRTFKIPEHIIALEKRIIELEAVIHTRLDKLDNRLRLLEKSIDGNLQGNKK